MPISFFGGARKNDFVKNLFCKSLQNFKVDFFSIASAKISRSMVPVGLGRDTTKIQNTPPFWHDQPTQRNALRQPTTLQLNAQASKCHCNHKRKQHLRLEYWYINNINTRLNFISILLLVSSTCCWTGDAFFVHYYGKTSIWNCASMNGIVHVHVVSSYEYCLYEHHEWQWMMSY